VAALLVDDDRRIRSDHWWNTQERDGIRVLFQRVKLRKPTCNASMDDLGAREQVPGHVHACAHHAQTRVGWGWNSSDGGRNVQGGGRKIGSGRQPRGCRKGVPTRSSARGNESGACQCGALMTRGADLGRRGGQKLHLGKKGCRGIRWGTKNWVCHQTKQNWDTLMTWPRHSEAVLLVLSGEAR